MTTGARKYGDVVRFQQTEHPSLRSHLREVGLRINAAPHRNGKKIALVHNNDHWLVVNQLVEVGNDTTRQVDCVTHEQDQGVLLERDLLDNLLRHRSRNDILVHLPTEAQLHT